MARPPPTTPAPPARETLRNLTVGAALLASTAMSGFGVASSFWDGLTRGDPAAWIGMATIAGAIAASEAGAVVIATAITKDGWTVLRGGVFGLCTIGNVLAGHFGAEAINTRLVAPARAPYESAMSSSAALLELAKNTRDDLERRHSGEDARLEASIEAERAATPGAVTARGRDAQRQREAQDIRQTAELTAAALEVTQATRDVAEAEAELEKAPNGFTQLQMAGFALLLEMMKGALVWITAPRRRRMNDGSVLSIDPAAYAAMGQDELEDILSRGRTASALAQHALKRLRRTAA